MRQQHDVQGGSSFPTTIDFGDWTEPCRRCVVEEKLLEGWSGCPSAELVDSDPALDILLLQCAAPAPQHLQPPESRRGKQQLSLPSLPRPSRKRERESHHETRLHQKVAPPSSNNRRRPPTEVELDCILSSPPRQARGCPTSSSLCHLKIGRKRPYLRELSPSPPSFPSIRGGRRCIEEAQTARSD